MTTGLESRSFGRIRLDQDGAEILLDVLTLYRATLIRQRAIAVGDGWPGHPYNHKVNEVERIIAEVRRLMAEKNWLDEPQREVP